MRYECISLCIFTFEMLSMDDELGSSLITDGIDSSIIGERSHFRAVKVKGADLVLELKVGAIFFLICRSKEALSVLLDPCNQMCLHSLSFY